MQESQRGATPPPRPATHLAFHLAPGKTAPMRPVGCSTPGRRSRGSGGGHPKMSQRLPGCGGGTAPNLSRHAKAKSRSATAPEASSWPIRGRTCANHLCVSAFPSRGIPSMRHQVDKRTHAARVKILSRHAIARTHQV
jgi:hypothetical protein